MNPPHHRLPFPAVWSVGLLCVGLLLHPNTTPAATPTLVRGPYLQTATPTHLTVRWRTDLPSMGQVRYGTSATNLDWIAEGTLSTNQVVVLDNLLPETRYYYAVGTPTLTLAGDTNHFFQTPPPTGSHRPIRIWALGDFGFTNQSAGLVRDAYYDYTGGRYTDIWLMLGDNAYHGGSDRVWQTAVFSTYATLLRQTVVWATIGNQETFNQTSVSDTAPYFDNLTLPTLGEAGGVPSGTEKYYSFDYGNVHFICLDSMTSARTNNSPMLQWLEADLVANTNEWLIAFWHHPPYSKGSSDSDSRIEQTEMRANSVRLLEAHGVDLVLGGHSHSFERSYLIDGHYGSSSTFSTNTMLIDGGDGRPDGDGPYGKTVLGPAPNQGTVYTVAGSGASLSSGALNHPVMCRSFNQLGSLVIDIQANRLEARFLRETGAIDDHFTIIKGAAPLRISSVSLVGGTFTIAWPSVAGRTYRVESTRGIDQPWTDVSGPIRAEATDTAWSSQFEPAGGGIYYRIRSAED